VHMFHYSDFLNCSIFPLIIFGPVHISFTTDGITMKLHILTYYVHVLESSVFFISVCPHAVSMSWFCSIGCLSYMLYFLHVLFPSINMFSHITNVVSVLGASCEISLGLTRVRSIMTSRHDVMVFMLRVTGI